MKCTSAQSWDLGSSLGPGEEFSNQLHIKINNLFLFTLLHIGILIIIIRTLRKIDKNIKVISTPTRPVDNVIITTKGLQDRNIHILAGTTVENKGKLIIIIII